MSFKEKYKEWLEAVKNTPQEKLIKINIQGYILQAIAILAASAYIFFKVKSLRFLIFIYIFSLFNIYTSLIASWKQLEYYKKINKEFELNKKENLTEILKIKSPHVRKKKIINLAYGKKLNIFLIIFSLLLSYLIVRPELTLIKIFLFLFSYYLIHYVLFYIISFNFAAKKLNLKLEKVRR